jgi:tRNA(Ile)-lysidine synthase
MAVSNLPGNAGKPNTILAVSGGVDSVVMAHLYHVAKMPFLIAHCNFQLRGEDSDKDEAFVARLGQQLGVQVLVKRFATGNYAAAKGLSVQMAARDLRYDWFKELAKGYEATIAIAHHANDVAETLLFNLTKGTGIAGLHGIAKADDIIVRPLLWAKKVEIEAYGQQQKLEWRQDQSNESEKYMRNIIRRKVIPELERVNPAFIKGSLRTARRIREVEEFMQYAIDQLGIIEYRNDHVYINRAILDTLPGRRAVLYNLLSAYGYSYDQVKSIDQFHKQPGSIFTSGGWVLNIDREHLIISCAGKVGVSVMINRQDSEVKQGKLNLLISVIDATGYQIQHNQAIAALDLDKLTFPLLLRNWQEGDYFVPLGMRGRKKVSDFLIDSKVPVNLKRDLLVLISGKEVAWLVGHRIDDRYKVEATTKSIYQIQQL